MIFMNFMSCAVHMATERVARAPDWCMAARCTGTYSSSVDTPRHTCTHTVNTGAGSQPTRQAGEYEYNRFNNLDICCKT